MAANPITDPGAFDVFKVAGVALPGIPKVTGCVDASKLDVHDGSGTSGAKVGFQGKSPKPFKVQLHLMTAADYDQWLYGGGRLIIMQSPTGKNPKAYDVEHPKCQICNITSATTQNCFAPEEVGDGSWTVDIEMMPNIPPTPGSGVPTGSTTKTPEPDAKDAADKEIDALTKEAEDLAK